MRCSIEKTSKFSDVAPDGIIRMLLLSQISVEMDLKEKQNEIVARH